VAVGTLEVEDLTVLLIVVGCVRLCSVAMPWLESGGSAVACWMGEPLKAASKRE
jgi:hypothetical protein